MDYHALTVNVLYLEVAQFGATHAGRLQRHQHGAMEQIAG
jgi:hypothetical protein